MQTNPAVEQNKTLNGPLVREISLVSIYGEVYGGKDLRKRCVLSLVSWYYVLGLHQTNQITK